VNGLDRLIRRLRTRRALRHIPPGTVLDIGCHDGFLLNSLGDRLAWGVGLDPCLTSAVEAQNYRLLPSTFPAPELVGEGCFDAVTALAVLEHVPTDELGHVVQELRRCLAPTGRAILTVPSPLVDYILRVAMTLRILHGMEAEQHHHFDVGLVKPLFESHGFRLVVHERFQWGLNNLFVFES